MGAHPVAQGSAGEVIKENGSLGGKKKKKKIPRKNFMSLLETSHSGSRTQSHAHTRIHSTQPRRHAGKCGGAHIHTVTERGQNGAATC